VSESLMDHEAARQHWRGLVTEVLAENPDFAADTVNAVQAGVMRAIERSQERCETVSMGLWAALLTERRAKTRRHNLIIDGIRATLMHPTPWSKHAIEREERNRDDGK
jgi:hypothetical protein